MEEKDLHIDRRYHVVYSKRCKEIIRKRIHEHYPAEEADGVFEAVQHQYERYLSEYCRRDLGGKKNFHNGVSGTYDCIMLVSYYEICQGKSSFSEVQAMAEELTIRPFKKLGFIRVEKPFFKRLAHLAFRGAEKKCAKWRDYEMHVDPYAKDKPLHYCFTRCPFADFVRQFGLQDIAGALCNVDYPSVAAMNMRLFRQHTCVESDHCDYTFLSPEDPFWEDHPEYVDEKGFIRNQ